MGKSVFIYQNWVAIGVLAGSMMVPLAPVQAQSVDEEGWLSDVALEPQATPMEATVQPTEPSGYVINAISITGSETLTTQDFGDVIAPYIGQRLNEDDLRKLTQEIADSARGDGYVLATARIPRQTLNQGILRIELSEGRIDAVRIIGSDNGALAATLNPLAGRYAHKKEVERAVFLAGDIPNIIVQKSRFVQENGQNILEVTVRERGPGLVLSLDNYGTDRFGPMRLRAAAQGHALLFGSDTASVNVRTNPADPKEFVYAGASYELGIGHNGTRLGVSGTIGHTQPGPGSSGFSEIEGDSRFASVEASHPIICSSGGSVWINASAAYLTIEQESLGALLSTDTQVTFSLGLASNHRLGGGRLRVGVTATQGADLLGATRRSDTGKSRFDGDGVFRKASAYINWSGPLWGNLGLTLSGYGQIADRPLLAAQEIGIGGAYSARGFDFSEISGDTGVYGLAELNYTFKRRYHGCHRCNPMPLSMAAMPTIRGRGRAAANCFPLAWVCARKSAVSVSRWRGRPPSTARATPARR